MKLQQFHNTTFVTYEITETSLKVTARTLFRQKKRDYSFGNILIKDLYDLEHFDKSNLSYIAVFAVLFGIFAEHAFVIPNSGWTMPVIFAALALVFIVRFFIRRTKIYIPTKDQGLIHLFQKQPNKKAVDDFIYVLEGKVNLYAKKKPEKVDLREFLKD